MIRSSVIPHDTAHGPFLVELADIGSFQEAGRSWPPADTRVQSTHAPR